MPELRAGVGKGTWDPDAAPPLLLAPGWPHLGAATFGVGSNFPVGNTGCAWVVPGEEQGTDSGGKYAEG